jgi:phage terminase large subunit
MFVNPSHKDFFTSNTYYLVSYGGAGSGKSYSAMQKEIVRALQTKEKTLFLRKVARTLRHSVYSLILQIMHDVGFVKGLHYETNKTDMTIHFLSSGSEFVFQGLDDVEKLKSITGITRILIEEASEVTQEDFNQVDLRLRGDHLVAPQVTLLLNPINVNHWIKKRFVDSVAENVEVYKTTYKDNTRLDEAYKKKLESLKDTDEDFYKVYCLGEWGNPTKDLIFTNYSVISDANFKNIRTPSFFGLDFGFVHPTALVELKYYEGQVYADLVYYREKAYTENLLEDMKRRGIRKSSEIYADHAYPSEISKIRNAGYSVFKANKSVNDGILFCKGLKINITSSSQEWLREREGYKYKVKSSGEVLDEPVKFNDDAMDATRYGDK